MCTGLAIRTGRGAGAVEDAAMTSIIKTSQAGYHQRHRNHGMSGSRDAVFYQTQSTHIEIKDQSYG